MKQRKEFNARRLSGHCLVLTRRAAVSEGDTDYSAFTANLNQTGVKQLNVNIIAPRTPRLEYSHRYLLHEPPPGAFYLEYQIPVQSDSSQTFLHLEYGFGADDLYRAFSILAGFILLPL